MFNDLKTILGFILEKQAVRFSYIFKNLPLEMSVGAQPRMKTFLIDEGIVENFHGEGNEFGREAEYSLTDYGKRFHAEMLDFEILDKILYLLSENKGKRYLSMQQIFRNLDTPFEKRYELKLLGDSMVDFVESKSGKEFQISISGENHFFVHGGYRGSLEKMIEETIREFKVEKKMKEGKEQPIQNHKHIYAQQYFENNDSVVHNQGTINQKEPAKEEPKKNSWLQNLYWIIGILVALTVLYSFVKVLI